MVCIYLCICVCNRLFIKSNVYFSGEKQRGQKGRRQKKGVPAWSNFHLNVDELMTAMFPDCKLDGATKLS